MACFTCSSLDSVVIMITGTPGARFCERTCRRNSRPSIEGMLMSDRIRSTCLTFNRSSPSVPLPASCTTRPSRPAWRSARSTILRITEESSTIRVRISLMRAPVLKTNIGGGGRILNALRSFSPHSLWTASRNFPAALRAGLCPGSVRADRADHIMDAGEPRRGPGLRLAPEAQPEKIMHAHQARLNRTQALDGAGQHLGGDRLRGGFDQVRGRKDRVEQACVSGAKPRLADQAALDAQPGHALEGKREHGIQPVGKTKIKQAARGHTQWKRAEGVEKEARHQRRQRIGVEVLERQHRAAPLQAEGAGDELLAHAVQADQPLAHATRAGRLLGIEGLTQFGGVDPALLEHDQAQRNAVRTALVGGETAIELAADGEEQKRFGACR